MKKNKNQVISRNSVLVRNIVLLLVCVLISFKQAVSKSYYVSTKGDDKSAGTIDEPFKTIQRAVQLMKPGDICYIREGIYFETIQLKTSGSANKPLKFTAYQNEEVIIDGTTKLQADWSPYKNGIFVTSCEIPVEQLFDGVEMLSEARWPNSGFNQRWERNAWASSTNGSLKDTLVCKELIGSSVDWTGAYAVLNVGQQFFTKIRQITGFNPKDGTFTYKLGFRPPNGREKGEEWEDDYFYIFGKLDALDAPGEWFYDETEKKLYFMPVKEAPEQHDLFIKTRKLGFFAQNIEHVVIQNLNFHACTFHGENCNNIKIDNCHFRYPVYNRIVNGKNMAFAYLSGKSNTIEKSSLAYSQLGGFLVKGDQNKVIDCIVYDANWLGDISYAGINTESNKDGNRIQNCTVYKVGNIGVYYRGPKNEILGNHVFETGKMCKDISAIHTGSAKTFGSVCAWNWVHESSGLGIRGDDQTRGLTVHHNVIWNTGFQGMIVKGDTNQVYNNTIFHLEKGGSLVLPVREEPDKWWTKYERLKLQNKNSIFINNMADIIAWRDKEKHPDHFSNNIFLITIFQKQLRGAYQGQLKDTKPVLFVRDLLEDPENWDFRPKADTEPVDNGQKISGLVMESVGAKPDIGAYERGGEQWIPGATWRVDDLKCNFPLGNNSQWETGTLPKRVSISN